MKNRLTAIFLAILLVCTVISAAIPGAAAADVTGISDVSGQALSINQSSLKLGIGETYTLRVSGADSPLSWSSSSDAAFVLADTADTAQVTAKAKGDAVITAVTANGGKITCNVTILPMAQSLSLNYSKLMLKAGETADLDSFVPNGFAAYHRDYETDHTEVVSVTKAGGIVTALTPGTAKVYCKLRTGVEAFCEVEVIADDTPTEPTVEAETLPDAAPATEAPIRIPAEYDPSIPADDHLSLNKSALKLGVGEEYPLILTGAGSAVTWTADSEAVSIVDNGDGTASVKAAAAGEATVTAATLAGGEAKCAVTVLPMADSLTLNKTSITLGIGEAYDLDSEVPAGTAAYFRTYSSSAPSVATVAASGGIVRARSAGKAEIYCTMRNGAQAKCVVTVLPYAKSLSLNKTAITLGVGEEYDLDSYVPKGTAAYFRTYSSSKTSVASVAANGGLVRAKAAGTANIVCALPNGVKTKCVVTVKPMASSLTLNKTRVRLRIGAKADLDSTVPSGTAAYYRYYSSDDPKVAKVTKADGIVTAVAEGTTTVYCTLKNGKTAKCEIQVMSQADSISEKNGIIVNFHGHNNYNGEDVWGKNTLEASVVDWMIGNWACCSYFEGNATWRCAEWGRYVRNTRAASQATTDFSDLKMTPANIRKIAKGCKPGTTMSFGPKYIPSHMIVLLRVTDDYIWWADCNWNWDNRIHYREATLEEFVNFVHWLPTPNNNGYIISISKITKLNTYSKPVTNPARYRNLGDARIVWTKVDGAKSYEVYQVTGSGDKLISTQTATSYTNTDSIPGTKYTYYVKAVMKNNKKIAGNKVSIPGRLDAPYPKIDRINKCIRWDPVEGATGYKIFRRNGIDGSFKAIKTIKGTTYQDSVMNFKAGEYDNSSYRVQAISSKGESASSVYSDIVAISQEYCMP